MKIYDLIIIGGGPAGVSAGIYAARQKLDTLLITKGFGGQMAKKAVAIENYPGLGEISGMDLVMKFEKHLRSNNIEVKVDLANKVKKTGDIFSITTKEKKEYQSKTVIVASGADPRPLEIPGEKEYIGKGVSYCVTCDGPLFSNKDVAVIGGGNAAFEAAFSLTKFARKVYILEYLPEIKADEANQQRVKDTGKVEIITNVLLKKIDGGKFVESTTYENNATKESSVLKVSGIFVEIGSQPATSVVKDLVDFSERDEIVVDPKTCQTKTPGLFAAGDVSNTPFKQIVVAAGSGAVAALSVSNYLKIKK